MVSIRVANTERSHAGGTGVAGEGACGPDGDVKERLNSVINDLVVFAADSQAAFGALSAQQLNWKPAERSWSIAQCYDHLIMTHGRFIPIIARHENGKVEPTFWEKYSPLSGFFGRFLIDRLRPENPKKLKTTGRGQPSQSLIDDSIIERFCEHQTEFIEQLGRLPAGLDLSRIIITSPMLAIFTYSLDDWLTIAVFHCRRHFGQAKRVMENAGFPA